MLVLRLAIGRRLLVEPPLTPAVMPPATPPLLGWTNALASTC